MANLVLYRKYRPQKFSEFIGQEHIVKTLTNAISLNLLSHAYLFSGPRGSGKTTLARIFAKAINCQNRKEKEYEPCDKCFSCLEILKDSSLDLVEIDAASHRGIDEMRELKEKIGFLPVYSKYKVFIIDESHQLSKDAANALLKTLEEPPSHAIFILATTEAHKMIPTIASRCQRFDFKKLTIEEIVEKLKRILKQEKIKIDDEALKLIAQNAEGSLRDAESLLEQCITFLGREKITLNEIKEFLGILDFSLISGFVDFLLEKNSSSAINFLEEQILKGLNLDQFLKSLILYFKNLLILKLNPQLSDSNLLNLTKEEFIKIKNQAEKIEKEELEKFLEMIIDVESQMKYSSVPQLPLELAIVKICGVV